ncbi:MAG TPA: FHA domain-containing protein, partial [Firmicutes bacterium]|nr:FHA domain-containing protein [Bacillota bacterium]
MRGVLDLLATAWRLLLIVVIYAFLWRLSLEVIRGSVPDGAQQVASLVVISTPGDPPAGTRFRLEDMVTIGRGPENDIVVKDSFASWHHAEVYRRGTRIFVEDLNSK